MSSALPRSNGSPRSSAGGGPPNEAELRRQAEGRDEAQALTIERDDELIGLIQYQEQNEPDFRHAGLDVFLAERS
jgi:hypothetical protein